MVNTQTQTATQLMKLTCFDLKSEVRLTCYADMIVRDRDSRITAIRFGGYPEQIRAMSDCISGGCSVDLELALNAIPLMSDKPNGYYRRLSHDGLYAESILYLTDGEQKSISLTGDDGEQTTINAKRNLYVFCEDAGSEVIFRELDRKLSIPLIPQFKAYFLDELQNLAAYRGAQVGRQY